MLDEIATKADVCKIHGEFLSRNYLKNIWTKCPKCSEEFEAKRIKAEELMEQERRLAAWTRRIGGAGIPERFFDRKLDSFFAESEGQKRALKFARSFAENFDQIITTGQSALFVGKPGTGKTHLAVGIGLHLLANRRPVLFTTVMRAIRRVKDTWKSGSQETESQAVASLVFPDLLILDEVGVQFGSEFERNLIFDVLNERYEKRRPTLLLSNLTVEEVKGYLGERVFDRLREDGGQFIAFDWESYRSKVN